jgi:hypothetical protein
VIGPVAYWVGLLCWNAGADKPRTDKWFYRANGLLLMAWGLAQCVASLLEALS